MSAILVTPFPYTSGFIRSVTYGWSHTCRIRVVMVDQVLKLQEKRQLTGSDAFSVIQLLQEQTLPIFSLRNASLQPILNVRSTQSKHSQPSRRREKTSPNQHTHRPSLHQRVSPRGDGSPASVVLGSTPLKLDSVEEFPPIGSTVITTPR